MPLNTAPPEFFVACRSDILRSVLDVVLRIPFVKQFRMDSREVGFANNWAPARAVRATPAVDSGNDRCLDREQGICFYPV